MSEGYRIVCFHCGQTLGDPPALNTTGDGEACPVCAERLLETLPPIFHSPMPFEVEVPREGGEVPREGETGAEETEAGSD